MTIGETTETQFLSGLGIQGAKIEELLKNKRVKAVLPVLQRRVKEASALAASEKKLMYKVIEVSNPETADIFTELVLSGAAKQETDLKNIESVLKHNPQASSREVEEIMKKNVPALDEMVEVATSILQAHAAEPRARLLKELKHHPRLQFVPPKTLLELLEEVAVTRTSAKAETKETPNQAKIEELLELGAKDVPPTRTINKAYQKLTVSEEHLSSKERKWTRYLEGEMQEMHTPFTNYQKTPEILRNHIKRTKGQVRVRFPPEPNGHLHIGHAKAMSINFGFRDFYKGWISLRYDDTNPKAEKTIYYDKILEMVRWMGYTPDEVTYASDYFQKLYESAVELIKRGKAYVCHETRQDVSDKRKEAMDDKKAQSQAQAQTQTQNTEAAVASPWRNRTVEENLAEFEKMKNGHYEEKEAVLRMKMDMSSDNPQLWDLVAYRVLKHPHPRTGDTWVIYPSYDFTHCLTDSFEDITHSFCTTEFINSRASYYWLCHALDLYCPIQWEYSRLCIADTLLSKRFITKTINEGAFTGWDDPRLSTLEGLRSKGVPAPSIRRFVESLGITTVGSEIPRHLLDNAIREELSLSPKASVVIDPITLHILSTPPRSVLINRGDYRSGEYDPSFYRLQHKGVVFLKNVGAVEFVKESSGELWAKETDREHSAVIQWAESTSATATVEIIQGTTIHSFTKARVSPEPETAEPNTYWQFIRLGFFIRVPSPDLVFRMVVPLKAAPLLEGLLTVPVLDDPALGSASQSCTEPPETK
ncbi:glutaminyl-tRNA synthetase [Nematocida displodere]|uniref:glutamine--tRNA ligase n=1 Tax=Nematocida displodere TaxID=1805483 RepID=A0A177EJ12_9MICR|nr:glutaminyl-tRNA synthetase [Nematocida displodere]